MKKNFIYFWGNYVSKLIPGKMFYPEKTGKITNNLFTICDKDINIYVYSKKSNTICIDAGYKNNNYLRGEFDKIGINPGSITHLFLTHTDEDHAGAVDCDSDTNWLDNAKVYMGREEEKLIKGKIYRKFLFYTPVTILRRYNLIDDGFEINIGDINIKAILTPGHTPGHFSYLIDNKILITGDLLLLKKDKIIPFYYIWNKNNKELIKSIKKISVLKNIEILCTAHSGYSYNLSNLYKFNQK